MQTSTMSSKADDRGARIAIFASGGGSNALRFMEYFEHHPSINVSLVVANKYDAGVLGHAFRHNVPSLILNKNLLNDGRVLQATLDALRIDFVVLAGFLLMIPQYLIDRYPNRIVNIHPALLPKYGGKGMYGMNVHRAVREAGERESGITIHFVNEHYDEGRIIAQFSVALDDHDTPETIAKKVQELEHAHYPAVVEETINHQSGYPRSDN